MLKFIGIILGSLVGIFLILIFIQIKIKVIWNDVDQYLQISYLFYKYNMSLKEKVSDVAEKVEESLTEFTNETIQNMSDEHVLHDVDINSNSQRFKVARDDFETLEDKKIKMNPLTSEELVKGKGFDSFSEQKGEKTKKRILRKQRVQHAETVKQLEKIKFRQKRKKFLIRLKQIKLYSGSARRIIFRFVSKIHVHKLGTLIQFNVSEPMINGFLYGGLWSVSGWLTQCLKSHVKKVDELNYDIQTQFTGNNIFVNFECIVSIRLVDIILVVILSLKDLLIIKKAYKLKEELS